LGKTKISYWRFQSTFQTLDELLLSGGASAVTELGRFEVRKSSSQVTRMHLFFFSKKLDFFSGRAQNTGRQRSFTVKIKQIKQSDMVSFLFSGSHY